MAIIGDVLQFVVYGKINGQVWQNVAHYMIEELSIPLNEGEFPDLVEDYVEWYLLGPFASLSTVTPDSMTWDGVKGENLFNETELGEIAFAPGTEGTNPTDALAQFAAYSFTNPSGRRRMNPGARRVPGVMEVGVGQYGALVPSYITNLTATAASYSQDITLEFRGGLGEMTIRPVIVKRVKEPDPDRPGKFKYRLPQNTAERVTYRANNWSIEPFITTQNSRKTGRGI